MNDPDDLYYCTYGELVEGQKYRFYTTSGWSKVGLGLAWNADRVVQAQRWVEPPPPPVTVEIEADTLASFLRALPQEMGFSDAVLDVWDTIHDAHEKAKS